MMTVSRARAATGIGMLFCLLLTARSIAATIVPNGDFESPTLEHWTPTGDATVVEQAFEGKHALQLARAGENLVPTSAVSDPFDLAPGEYDVACAARTALYAQDMSFNLAVQIRFLSADGKTLQTLDVAAVQGETAWKPLRKRCTAPVGTARGQLVIELNKTFGKAWVDGVKITPTATESILPRRVKLSTKYVGNLFYPEDRVRLLMNVQTPVRLTGEALKVQWDVRDYWNAPVCEPRIVTLTEKGQTAQQTWEYETTIDASSLPLVVGPYYEVHTQLKVDGFPTAEDMTSFAILPESSTTAADPLQVPFGTHTWDDRVTEYFSISARMGLRRCSIFWNWPSDPPYTPDFKGSELDCRINTPERYGLHPFAIVYPIFDIERGQSKHTDESLREGLRQTVEMYKKDGLCGFQLGNEPPFLNQKMIERDVEVYRIAYEAIKKADPSMIVIGSAIGPSEEFFKLGFQNYCDAMNIHGYGDLGEQRHNMQKYQQLFAKYGGKKPIYTTEIGSMSQGLTRHEIACDIVRKASSFFADGGEMFTWFAITFPDKDGTRRGSYADSMDLFSGYLEQFNPRLDAVGYFHFVDQMGVKKFVQEVTYANGTTAMLFRDGQNNCLQVLWNLTGSATEVSVPLAGVHEVLATHIDGVAKRMDAGGTGVSIRVGTEPTLLAYRQTGGTLPAELEKPALSVSGELPDLVQGGSATLTFEVARADAVIELITPPFWTIEQSRAQSPTGQNLVSFNIAVPANSPARAGRIMAILRDDHGSAVGESLVTLPIKSRIDADLLPLASLTPGKAGVRLTVSNNGADPQTINWKVELPTETPMKAGEFDHGHAGRSTAYFADVADGQVELKAGETRVIDLALANVQPLSLYNVRAQVTDAGGKTLARERYMGGFDGVPKIKQPIAVDGDVNEADWARAPVMHINDARQFFTYSPTVKWNGPADLSGKLRFLWDDNYLYLSVEVTDDIFSNPKSDGGVWAMDGLQMLVDPYRDRSEKLGRYDYYAGVGQKGPQVWRGLSADGRAPSGEAKEILFAGKRTNPKDGSMTYEMAIPWRSLAPFVPAAGRNLGIGLIINEDDGGGRKSFLGWFGGAHNKTVNQVGDLILLPD